MKYLFLPAAISAIATSVHAQQPTNRLIFCSSTGAPDSTVAEPTDAVYRIRRLEVPGQSRLDSVFYVASKRLLSVTATTWHTTGDTIATVTHWRANGNKHSVSQELGRKAHGEQLRFDSEGHLREKSQFRNGKKISTQFFTVSGAPVSEQESEQIYKYTEKMPEFPGGSQAMLAHIARTMRYPNEALKKGQQGRVIMTFVLDETGQVRAVRVKQGVSPALDAEAVRVIRSLPRFEPGQQSEETVPVYFTVPVTFVMK